MKLYAYHNENGEIKTAEIEVKEKVVLVPEKDGDRFPFIYEKEIDREDVGKLLWFNGTIFYKRPSFDEAKEKFIEEARKIFKNASDFFNEKEKVLKKLMEQEEKNAD